ncbi:hypothetical protein [Marinovum algicola]|uniref:hypothetical protein n=1 Tax=Marinovum algicola TaxID=42444 RepID=UPI001B8BC7B6|nr:hypothetical protein [Marinovum algicola]
MKPQESTFNDLSDDPLTTTEEDEETSEDVAFNSRFQLKQKAETEALEFHLSASPTRQDS